MTPESVKVIVDVEPVVEGSSPVEMTSELEGSPPEREKGGDPRM